MLRSLSRLIAGLWLLLAAGTALSAPILIVDVNGKLTGARGVEVGGILYDVDFRDGTCVGLFSGCNDPTDFAFTTLPDASAANAALIVKVFVDGAQGQFDTHPELTEGCANADSCQVATPFSLPFATDVNVALTVNFAAGGGSSGPATIPRSADSTPFDTSTWAIWSRTEVPEPPTYACLLLAAGIALAMSRRSRTRAGQHQRL